MVSPGCSTVLRTLPDHHSLELRPDTVPFARTTNISFLLAMLVGPPACFRYQPACLRALKVMPEGLYTWPATITKFGLLGMYRVSPERTSMSTGVFCHFSICVLMWISMRPLGWIFFNWSTNCWRWREEEVLSIRPPETPCS